LKATLRQLLIVVCLLSIVSDVTPVPPPQELPHHDEDTGGWLHPDASPSHATAAPAPSPAPRHGSSFSSPPHYSSPAEPQRSATWPMISTARCGAKSSPSGGAIVPIRGRACQCHPGPGGPPCGGVAKGAALGSGVGGGGRGAGSQSGCCRHCAWRNTPVSLLAGRQESQTRTCASQRHGLENAGALWA
jgi:hypothetical protein